jgi:dolichol-phosphate mannosyltransferase
MIRLLLLAISLTQALFAVPVVLRMIRGRGGEAIRPTASVSGSAGSVSLLIPVLNERHRLAPCLKGVSAQGPEVAEIIVADGGSTDGTQQLVRDHAVHDDRLRLVEAGPAPAGKNGKANNLAAAAYASDPSCRWMVTIDADVRPGPLLVSSLVDHALAHNLFLLSGATQQRLAGKVDAILHPSMLSTLIYRFGIPGHATSKPGEIQANGQCFLIERQLLESLGGFESVADSICEDVTLARAAASRGVQVGFYETGSLVDVEMYASWLELWQNWPRSLPMHDRYAGTSTLLGLTTVTLVQALPLWAALLGRRLSYGGGLFVLLNRVLFAMRIGTLFGSARAYKQRPWTYWLSPVADGAVALKLWISFVRRRHTWRGRKITRGASS